MKAATAAVTAIALAYFALFVGYGMEVEDEGLILAQAHRTFLGDTPHLDYETGYTPGVFYLNAALFRLFGESTVPVRWTLALVNAGIIGLLFALVRSAAGTTLAAATALGYAALLPVFPGQFASFNIPYPAWYANLFWLGTQAAVDRHLRRPSGAALFAAGALAGLAFTFKPNAGALAVLATGLALALPVAAPGDPDRHLGRLLLLLAALAIAALPFVDLTFELDSLFYNYTLLAAPLLLLIAGWAVLAPRPIPHAWPLRRSLAVVTAGVLLPTLPWLAFFFHRLGPDRFARDVLLIGTGAEGLYGTGFPVSFGSPDDWAALAVAWIAVVAIAGLLLERRPTWLRFVLLGIAAATTVGTSRFVDLARMPEGFTSSVTLQLQIGSFVAVPPLLVLAVGRTLQRLRRSSAGTPENPRWIGALVFAPCMLLLLYPRMDSMHMIFALPSTLVVAGAAMARAARAWSAATGIAPRRLVAAIAAATAGLAAITAGPGVAGALAPTRVVLDSPRLPVHVEASRGVDLSAFGHVLDFLAARLGPDDRVFGFPAVGIVPWAIGRPSLARSEYFFPGRPDHEDETRLLETFAASPPRFVVTLRYRLGYFFESPIYYFLLRDWVHEHYRLAARAGRYDVLERIDDRARAAAAVVEFPLALRPPQNADETLEWMKDPDRELRRLAVESFLTRAGGADGVGPLAEAWAPDETRRLILIRSLGEAGDERILPWFSAEIAGTTATERERIEIHGALLLLTLRDALAPNLFANDQRSMPPAAWRTFDLDRLRAFLATRDGRLGFTVAGSYVLAAAGDPASIPVLEDMWAHEEETRGLIVGTWMRVAVAEALVRLGRLDHLCDLVDLFGIDKHEVQDIMPSRWILEARRAPDIAHRCLARGLGAEAPLARKLSAYLAAAMPLPALAPELRAATNDSDPGVRYAATWALGRLTAPGARD